MFPRVPFVGSKGLRHLADLPLLIRMHRQALIDHLQHVRLHFAGLRQRLDRGGQSAQPRKKLLLPLP